MHDFIPATRFDEAPNLDMRFPPLPRTVTVVTKLLNEQGDTPDMNQLVDSVNTDPVVAASVLKRINSAYYGMRRRVGDIRKAVFLLGFLEVSNMILTEGMMRLRSIVRSEEQVHIFEHIMRMSIGAATYAQELANHLSLPRKSTAFTGGILHAIGRLVMLYNKPHDYEALWWTNDQGGGPAPESEQIIFGTDHVRLGVMAADRWQLPEDVVAIIENYRTPDKLKDYQLKTLALTVSVGVSAAEQLCLEDPAGKPFTPPESIHMLAKAMQVPASTLIDLIEASKTQTYAFVQEVLGQ